MIVRMSRIEILGPKELLLPVLALIRELEVFQVDPEWREESDETKGRELKPVELDRETLNERIFLSDLRLKIDELCACLPGLPARESYLNPENVLHTIAATVEEHGATCRELARKRELLCREKSELERHATFLAALSELLGKVETKTGLEFIGVTIKDPAALEQLMTQVHRLTAGKFEIVSLTAADNTLIGLITTPSETADKVKRALSVEHVPELSFPPALQDLSLPEKLRRMAARLAEVNAGIAAVDQELEHFSRHWLAIYLRVRAWVDDRLAILKTSASVHETDLCFFIHGWLPAEDLVRLCGELQREFAGMVVVEERQMLEEELENVPVALKNPPYFRPFEQFARLLPLPRYTSYDPTPFLGIFFPLFFGMMLGDTGHGLVLLLFALGLLWRCKKGSILRDGAQILLVSSLYAIFFGFCYGEFFGSFGRDLFGFSHLVIERETAILPMLIFALSVGVMHIVLGLILGLSTALKRKSKKEALFKLVNIGVILCLVVLALGQALPLPKVLFRPIIITLAVSIPLLFISGGLLAPLEMLKNIGNIISYTRIMAIGLTSVFLATAANQLAGRTGEIVTGTIVAGLLHGVSIIVGIFAPTVHALRLHYVEFFSKFLEHGGKRFAPLKR